MMREIVFLISSFLVCWKGVYPFLDIDELKNIHYDIDIVDQPVLYGRPLDQEVVYMTSKYGQQYECQLPDITELEVELEEEKAASEIGISELLKPMETAPCIRKTKDWWSYEFCYGKQIDQFHLEQDKIVGDVVTLGFYQSETDWSENATTDSRKNRLNRYHSHNYVNGTKCDINGKPRQAEVRFHCAEGEGDSISRIDEPTTCSYILTIHTTRICHHPYLKPPPKVKPKSVLCSPALTQDQFDIYLYHEEKAKIELKKKEQEIREKAEEKTAAWLESLLGTSKKVEQEDEDSESEDDTDASVTGTLEEDEELAEVLEKYSDALSVENIDAALSAGVEPKVLAKLLENVMSTVQDSIEAIDEEVDALEAETMKDTMSKDEEDREEDDNEEEEEDDDEIDKQDYKALLDEFRDGIDEMGVSDEDAQRLQALADELEKSFQTVESVDKLLNQQNSQSEEEEPEEEEPEEEQGDEDASEDETENSQETDEGEELLEDGEEVITSKEDGDRDEEEDQDEDEEEDEAMDEKEAEKKLVQTVNEMIKKLKADPGKGKALGTSSGKDAEDEDGADDRVRVRVTRIKMNQDTGSDAREKEVNLYDTEHKSLEDAIRDHLEQSGIQVEGGKIELKVLTFKPDDWPEDEDETSIAILSEEETTYFKNIVSGLLGHQGQVEEVRHQKLENNYRFHWNSDSHRVEDSEEEPSLNTAS